MRASQNTIETISTIGIDVGKDKPDVLDPAGGTDIFHMAPGRVKLTAGTDAMRCLSLSNKVLRWYTECCRTPIANTPPGPGFPVIGMVHSFMDHGTDSCSRDEVLGPPSAVSMKVLPSGRSRATFRAVDFFGLRITFSTFPGRTYRPMCQCASMLAP
jgi:hypothetical protein